MVGCPAHSGDARPGNARNGFRGPHPLSFFGGEFSEARSSRCCVSVCLRRDASVPPAGVFADPTPAAWGTQITYVRHISRVGIVLKYENKSDRLRQSEQRQTTTPAA